MSEFSIIQPKHKDVYDFISPGCNLKNAAKGRSVLITGAGTGIGKATAISFAEAGSKTIVVVGRRINVLEDVKAEIEKKFEDCQVLTESVDVSNANDVEQLFERLQAQAIELDVLINNAGVNLSHDNIRNTNVDDWWKTCEINLKGPFLMTRAFLRARTKKTPAAIIMTSSLATNAFIPLSSAYGSIKAALTRLTEWVDFEERARGVQAIAFHPGGIANTDMTSTSPDFMQSWFTEKAELAAGTALYLSTDRAGYLGGRWVDARWDMEELESWKSKIGEEDLLKMSLLGYVRKIR